MNFVSGTKCLVGQIFSGPKNFKWKLVPKKAHIWLSAGFLTPVSTPESDSPSKITSIKGLGRIFFGCLHKNAWRDEFFQGHKIFLRLTLCWKNLKWKVVPQKAQICPCSGFLTPISTPESDSPRKITSIKGLGRVFFGFLHKKRLAGRIFSEGTKFFYDWPHSEYSIQ